MNREKTAYSSVNREKSVQSGHPIVNREKTGYCHREKPVQSVVKRRRGTQRLTGGSDGVSIAVSVITGMLCIGAETRPVSALADNFKPVNLSSLVKACGCDCVMASEKG